MACGIEAEPQVVEAATAADPVITDEQLKEIVTLFRDAVYQRSMIDSVIKLLL